MIRRLLVVLEAVIVRHIIEVLMIIVLGWVIATIAHSLLHAMIDVSWVHITFGLIILKVLGAHLAIRMMNRFFSKPIFPPESLT